MSGKLSSLVMQSDYNHDGCVRSAEFNIEVGTLPTSLLTWKQTSGKVWDAVGVGGQRAAEQLVTQRNQKK